MVGIYKITNPEGKSYIGLSREIETRWNSYKNMQFQSNTLLKESFKKYGYLNHVFEVIEEVILSEDTYGKNTALLRKRERYWIEELGTFYDGLNQNGGGSGCGSHTSESKQKISESLKGRPKPLDFGEKRTKDFYTEEWKEKISKSNKGRKSPMKGKVGPNKGKIMSEEQKNKISKSNSKPKPKNFLNERKKQIIHINTHIIYQSISEAARQLNLPKSGISQCCSGKRKATKGNKFSYV